MAAAAADARTRLRTVILLANPRHGVTAARGKRELRGVGREVERRVRPHLEVDEARIAAAARAHENGVADAQLVALAHAHRALLRRADRSRAAAAGELERDRLEGADEHQSP